MSWFDNFTASVNNAITSLADSAIKNYNELSSYPETVQCRNHQCSEIVSVPASLFQWTCQCGIINPVHITTCARNVCTRPPVGPFEVTCDKCYTVTSVPTSTFVKNFREFVHNAPKSLNSTVNTIRSEVHSLTDVPEIFPCAHCSSILNTPTGPWMCHVNDCGQENTAESILCAKCAVQRYSLGVLCGICGRSTSIPPNKLQSQAMIKVVNVQNAFNRNTAYAANNPYVDCTHCSRIIHPPPPQIAQILRIPPPPTSTNEQGQVVASNELQLSSYEPQENPEEYAEITCANCLRIVRYNSNDVHCYTLDSRRSGRGQAASYPPQQSPRLHPPNANNEDVCYSCQIDLKSILKHKVICVKCAHSFCHDHAPFTRYVDAYHAQVPFCLVCAAAHDIEVRSKEQTPSVATPTTSNVNVSPTIPDTASAPSAPSPSVAEALETHE